MKNKLHAKLLDYNSIQNLTISDHKPVKAEFELSIEENEDSLFFKSNEEDLNNSIILKRYSSASIDSTKLHSCIIF